MDGYTEGVNLRSRTDLRELPLHHEWAALPVPLRLVGWLGGLACIIGAVVLAGLFADTALEPVAVVIGLVGVMIAIAVWRCGRWETVVTTRRVAAGAGPFRQRVPIGFVAEVGRCDATSWRRLYAREEVVLRLTRGMPRLAVPTNDPGTLIEAIDSAVDRERSGMRPGPAADSG